MADEAKKYALAETDYIFGMKYKDIAEKYGVSINTVKSWKKRYEWNREGAHKNKKGCTQNKEFARIKKEPIAKEVSEIIQNNELTDKQRLFCILYTKCFNATKAYQKAYECDYYVAATNGSRLLKNAKVKEEIHRLKQNRLNREMLDEEDIVQMYIDILYADITDYVDKKRNMINLSGPYSDGRLIKKVSFGKTDSIELMDKMVALKWLSEHMDLATEKQQAEIAALRAKAGEADKEDEQKREQAKNNITEILKQMRTIKDGDVYE